RDRRRPPSRPHHALLGRRGGLVPPPPGHRRPHPGLSPPSTLPLRLPRPLLVVVPPPRHPLMIARSLLLAWCATFALLGACGDGGDDKSTPSPTSAPARTSDTAGLEPVDVVRVTLDDINRGDIDAAYPNFSAEARKDVSLDEARRLLQGLQASGNKLSITVA